MTFLGDFEMEVGLKLHEEDDYHVFKIAMSVIRDLNTHIIIGNNFFRKFDNYKVDHVSRALILAKGQNGVVLEIADEPHVTARPRSPGRPLPALLGRG